MKTFIVISLTAWLTFAVLASSGITGGIDRLQTKRDLAVAGALK